MSEKSLDVEGLCRTCMSNRNKVRPGSSSKPIRKCIYENPPGWNDGPTILEILRSVKPEIPIHVKDKLPKVMCCDCIELLQVAYDFMQMYKDTDLKFRKMLNVDYTTANDPDDPVFVKEENEFIEHGPMVKNEMEKVEDYDAITTAQNPDVQENDPVLKFEIEMAEEGDNTAFHAAGAQLHPEYEAIFGQSICENEDNMYILGDWTTMEPSHPSPSKHMLRHPNSAGIPQKRRRNDFEQVFVTLGANEEYAETVACFEHSTKRSRKKIFTANVSYAMSSEKLKNLEDLDYKIIIGEHERSSLLENPDRTKIAQIVIRYVLQYDITIELNRYDFMFLADIITKVLPEETVDWYYLAAKSGQKPSGKLYDAYHNYRRRLSQSGLLKRRPYVRKSMGGDMNQVEIVENRAVDSQRDKHLNRNNQIEWTETQSIFDVDTEEDRGVKVSNIIRVETLQNLEDLDFKMIMKDHETSCLENPERTKLAKIIIRHLLEYDVNLELTRYDFSYLADIIKKILPQEPKDLYYSAARFGQRASGKLYDSYNNYRKRLSQSGLLIRRSYVSKTAGCDPVPEDSKDVKFVKQNSTFNEKFIDHWENCLSKRQAMLRNPDLTTSEFLEQFPVFNTTDKCIFQLFMKDLTALYPSFTGIKSWDGFYKNVFNKLVSSRDVAVQELLELSVGIKEDSKKAVAFLLLPYVFSSKVLKVRKRTKGVESNELFITHYETLNEADMINEPIANKSQPQLFFVGTLDKLTAYVTLCGKKYLFKNPLEAVEACFSTFMALNIKYPIETQIIWNFVQKYIFNITTQLDLNNIGIKTVYYKLTK